MGAVANKAAAVKSLVSAGSQEPPFNLFRVKGQACAHNGYSPGPEWSSSEFEEKSEFGFKDLSKI